MPALLAGILCAQQNTAPQTTAPLLANTGQPIQIPFSCTEEDIEWAGMSCSDREPCPVYFELTSAEPVGMKIFAAGNLHTDSTTLYSILLGSDDAGKSWREAYERMRGTGLDRIQFTDLLNGWISGESLFPLPQDPFLLITNDGGKSWHRQPIFAEPEPGSIQQFFFRSKDQGSLVIDRGEGAEDERFALYESPDGGGSWLVKQLSNEPIRLRRPEAAEDWRVRVDRATRSFRIEHLQGRQWIAAASFAIDAGACKPAPLEARPPQEPEPQTAPPAARPPKR